MSANRGKKCSFFGKFGVLCFLETPVLRFALLPYYRRFANDYKLNLAFKGHKLDISNTSLYKKDVFLCRISSVNVTKSAVSCEFGHIH